MSSLSQVFDLKSFYCSTLIIVKEKERIFSFDFSLLLLYMINAFFITSFYLRSFYCSTLIIVKEKEIIFLFDFSLHLLYMINAFFITSFLFEIFLLYNFNYC